MEKRGPKINYLNFAYETIIFTSSRSKSLKLIMKVLFLYEDVFGQLINKTKGHFIMPSNAFKRSVDKVKHITGFLQKKALFTYLVYPLYFGRQRIIYFSDLVSKVVSRISGWK